MSAARQLCAVLLFAAAHCAQAIDAEYKIVRIETTDAAVNVRLPLTDVTGKVRVKERTEDGLEQPVAPSQTSLNGSHYLEWQIGYDTLDAHHPSVAADIRFARKGEIKYGCELSRILTEAQRIGVINDDDLRRERDFLAKSREANLEDSAKIIVEKPHAEIAALPGGFTTLVEEIPMFTKETPNGRIEILLKPKQRAVGNQAMVYVCLNMKDVRLASGAPRPPGRAHVKETVIYRFDKENTGFLFDIVRAFGIASRQHNQDLTRILDCILKS